MVDSKHLKESFEENWVKDAGDSPFKTELLDATQVTDIDIKDENELNFLKETDRTADTLALYAALDDKNRTIQALKQRLMNQQLQLAYYLHKNLGGNNVLEFSSQCEPKITEENMQLSLAMFKFVRDTGGKNKLTLLHEKLKEYDKKVSVLLTKQEELVRSASKQKMDETQREGEDNNLDFTDRACKIAHLDLYNKIMNATVLVKKELQELRLYSEKVVQLETERNALVDYVFSLPPEQRLAGLNLIEKIKNKKIINENISFDSLSRSGNDSQTEAKYIGYQLTEVLSSMENDTGSYTTLTDEQRNMYNDEVLNLKSENSRLIEMLKITTEAPSQFKIMELEDKCNTIESDLEEVRLGLELEVADKDVEIAKLSDELKQAVDQSLQLEEQILELRNSVEAVITENELLHETLNELLKVNSEEKNIDEDLQEIIRSQKDQIKNLMLIICNLNDSCDNIVNLNNENSTALDNLSMNCLERDNNEEEVIDSGMISTSKTEQCLNSDVQEYSNYMRDNSRSSVNKVDSSGCSIDEERRATEYKNSSLRSTPLEISSMPQITHKISRTINKPMNRHNLPEKLTTTSLQVESLDNEGKREYMTAVLESSFNVEGLLELNNSSNLHLKLKCSSPDRGMSPRDINEDKTYSKSFVTLLETNKPDKFRGICEQLKTIKNEMDKTLRNPNGKLEVINSVKNIYLQLFGGIAESEFSS